MKIELFKQMCKNFNKELDEDLYLLWNERLRMYVDEEIKKAVNIIISKDKYFPTLSRFLEVIKEVVSKEEFDSEKSVREKMKRLNIKPDWLNKEVTNEPIDEETEEIFEDFNSFLEEFRNEKYSNK